MKIEKPWGWEEIIQENEYYRIKKIHVNSGHRLSKQYHNFKVETWIFPDQEIKIIPPKEIHRLQARESDIDIIEVSHGSDDDIVRIEDDYGRI